MANTVKRSGKHRKRYYVEEPVMMIPLAEYEKMVNHMTALAMDHHSTDHAKRVFMQRHTLIMKECRGKLKDAKEFYRIRE